jgi:hypothetical protein
MRLCSGMKALVWLPLLFGVCACADEISDRAAITSTIAALNEVPLRPGLFTADSDAPAVLRELLKGKELYRNQVPNVTISHEPWGEAALNFPTVQTSQPSESLNPRITSGAIRFTTRDVALVSGACTYSDGTTTQTTPLAFVMKKEGDV